MKISECLRQVKALQVRALQVSVTKVSNSLIHSPLHVLPYLFSPILGGLK